MPEKLTIILFSGTVDKLTAAGVIAQGAAAMGKKVLVFTTFWGLLNFKKGEKNVIFPKEFEQMAAQLGQAMQAKNISWYNMLKEAKEFGAKIYACSMAAEVMGLTKEDMDPIVDDVVGVATMLAESEDAQIIFI